MERMPIPANADIWADLVTQLLPRVLASDDLEVMEEQRKQRTDCALQLAAAALRAAGENILAENLLDN